LIQFLH
jgi:hypothetical protein